MRKRAIAVLAAALAAPTLAQEFHAAGFANNAGGWTIVTDRDQYCGARHMRDGYAFAENGHTVRFCWVLHNGAVFAAFEDGTTQAWPPSVFEGLAAEPEINNNQP